MYWPIHRGQIVQGAVLICVMLSSTLLSTESVSSASNAPDLRPKDHFKQGEKLQKQGKLYEAFDEYERAIKGDPKNKKYQSRLREVGVLASASAAAKGIAEMSLAPHESLTWFERALRYDSSNASAAEMLTVLNNNIRSASETAKLAKSALDNLDIKNAKDLVSSIASYRYVVPAISDLMKELQAADSAIQAQQLWDQRNADAAIGHLSQAELSAPESIFVRRVSETVRSQIADALIIRLSDLPSATPKELVEKLTIARVALKVWPQSVKATQVEGELSRALVKLLIEQNRATLLKETVDAHRVVLQTANLGTELAKEDPVLQEQSARAKGLAYPRIRVRVVLNDSPSCNNTLTSDSLLRIISEAMNPVASIVNDEWDLILSINNLACTTTEIPKQSTEPTNSTYVAGQNQLANPRYEELSQQLNAAQAELNRAIYQESINPNFGTGFAVGWWRGKVYQVQKALREISPFITKDIIQQYQYEKFQAYRSSHVEASLQLSGKNNGKQYLTRTIISELVERQADGISGVLPTDNTGARNREPVISPLDEYIGRSVEGFRSKLGLQTRELLTGYFATTAMDSSSDGLERLSAILYLTDIATGTQYEAQTTKLNLFITDVLLSGSSMTSKTFADITLRVPEPIAVADDIEAYSTTAESMLEKQIEGVLAIETDNGHEGSGFFVTNGCLVVTNEHVIHGAETIVLRTSSKRLFTANLLAKDDGRDLALLRTNARSCRSLTLDNSANYAIGQEVFAIGNPLGLSGTVTRGIISALRRDTNAVQYLQLDAAVNPGNSGGPIISRSGKVLGVNTFKVRGFEGLNFAVASSEIKKAFEQFLH